MIKIIKMKNDLVSVKVINHDDGNDLVRVVKVIVDDVFYDVRVYFDGSHYDFAIKIRGDWYYEELIDSSTYDMDDDFDEMIETFNKVSGFVNNKIKL